MSIGLGTIIVQNKKEPAGVSEAESGLHMDGSKARLGGMLLENTDIDIDTKTFFLQWDGGAGAFLIDVFDDKYFFGTIDGSFNLETGISFTFDDLGIQCVVHNQNTSKTRGPDPAIHRTPTNVGTSQRTAT